MDQFGKSFEKEWRQFVQEEKLSEHQEKQFEQYFHLLLRENELINLTAITEPRSIVSYHFRDSLRLRDFVDKEKIVGLCDVGTGAGFPGIPLKILWPDIPMVLIEVNNKKIKFLELLIQRLGLENCEVYPLDWRTFLRKTNYDNINMFCARASLQPEELARLFKPSCPYKDAQLVYWASFSWEPKGRMCDLVQRQEFYKVKAKSRKLVFFASSADK